MHEAFQQKGHAVIRDVFSAVEIAGIIAILDRASQTHSTPSSELFAVRRLLFEVPDLRKLLFTPALLQVIREFAPAGSFFTKSIYFDKPSGSNWFVAWHQDISISVKERIATVGYSQWTQKSGIIGVVPPLVILENTLTLRIHLDAADAFNGALRVVEGSHLKGIIRKEELDWTQEHEVVCDVPTGGVMLMRPLTLHASRRAQSGARRRVIHLEVCGSELEGALEWGERMEVSV